MRRIFGCLRINLIIPRIPVRIISTRERQGHIYQHAVPEVGLYSSRFFGFMSAHNRWHHARHTADRRRQRVGRWGAISKWQSSSSSSMPSKATKPRASDTTGRAWPVYLTLNCGWHTLAEVAVQVDRLVVSWAV